MTHPLVTRVLGPQAGGRSYQIAHIKSDDMLWRYFFLENFYILFTFFLGISFTEL